MKVELRYTGNSCSIHLVPETDSENPLLQAVSNYTKAEISHIEKSSYPYIERSGQVERVILTLQRHEANS